MRTFILLVVAVLGSIGAALGILAGTGQTNAVGYGDITAMFSGVTQYPDLQVALGLFNPGDPVANFSEVLDFTATPKGTTLADDHGSTNVELFFFLQKQPLLELIGSGKQLYARVDFSLLRQALPTAGEQSELTGLQSEFGKRWVELPTSLLGGLLQGYASSHGGLSLPTGLSGSRGLAGSLSPTAAQGILGSLERSVRDHAALGVGTAANGDNGVVVTGSIGSLLAPSLGAIEKIAAGAGQHLPALNLPTSVPGNYRVGFFGDQTGALRQIDVGLHSGISTAGFGIVINHAHVRIAAPSSAEPLSLSAIGDLVRLGRGLLPSSLLPTSLS